MKLTTVEDYLSKLYEHKNERKNKRMNILKLNLERYSHTN